MDLQLWISKRLKLAGSEGKSVSTGVVIAVIGVALALTVMELTLGVVLGFKHEIAAKLTGFDAKVFVGPAYDPETNTVQPYISFDRAIGEASIKAGVTAPMSLTLKQPGILKTDNDFAGMIFVGHDSLHNDNFERSNIVDGIFPDFNDDASLNDIVISAATSAALGLKPGDKTYSCFFVDGKIKTRRYTVAGVYCSDLGEYDNVVVYASLKGLQHVAGIDSLSGTRLEISEIADDEIETVSQVLSGALAEAYYNRDTDRYYPVSNVRQTGAIYFNWLQLLDTNVVVIFVLMLCVAAFTLVSSLFMIILDRVRTIGILRVMGVTKKQIRNIFILLGLKMVIPGILAGNVIALSLLFIQQHFHVARLDPDMYYLRYVPVEVSWWGIAAVNVGVVIAAWLIMIVPAMSAARTNPSKTMQFE